MAHEAQERYSSLVLAKIRTENKLKNVLLWVWSKCDVSILCNFRVRNKKFLMK